MTWNNLTGFYKKSEKFISPIGLIYGFVFTSLTLTRVDAFLENFWIVIHLLIAGFGILAITFYENLPVGEKRTAEDKEKMYFFLTLIIQFAFGGLFSTFFVFYLRSSSLIDSWFFLGLLLILLVGNEVWKKHYARLTFQISVFFVSLYLFLIFLLPTLVHRLGGDLFVYSGLISLAVVFLFLRVLRRLAREKFARSHRGLGFSLIGLFVLLNLLYFSNIIPPIPLSLKQAGVYHHLARTADGNYAVEAEDASWLDSLLTLYPVFHKQAGEAVYVFSAVFSPVDFSTDIIHQWQYFDETKQVWVNSTRISIPITGGRENGYRLYSLKTLIDPGLWRVRVETADGQVLGQIRFRVESATGTPSLESKTL